MRHSTVRLLVILCVAVILGSLVLRSVAGTLCLSALAASGCQRCCQPESSSETQVQVPACSLFCCTGLPDIPEARIPPVLSTVMALPGLHDLSVSLGPAPPPPKLSLSMTRIHLLPSIARQGRK